MQTHLKELRKKISEITGLEYKYNPDYFQGGYKYINPDIKEKYSYKDGYIYVLDFNSFYPHIIMQNNLFGADMSEYLKTLYLKKCYLSGEEKKVSKIALNSVYGMMKHYGNFGFNQTKTTSQIARNWIQKAKSEFEKYYNVLMVDTDSIILQDTEFNYQKIHDIKEQISKRLRDKCENPMGSFKLELENIYKFIYFYKKSDSSFAKSSYTGVTLQNQVIHKKQLSEEDKLLLNELNDSLRQGINYFTGQNKSIIEQKCLEMLHNKDRFINTDNITLLHRKKTG